MAKNIILHLLLAAIIVFSQHTSALPAGFPELPEEDFPEIPEEGFPPFEIPDVTGETSTHEEVVTEFIIMTQSSSTQSSSTQPPLTQPPSTQPPSTQPPSTQPPSTQPPSTQPPSTQPPTASPTTQTQPPPTTSAPTTPTPESQRPCGCGGPEWTRIVHLNMTDSNQECPSNWNLFTNPVRGCRSSVDAASCDSATFSTNGQSYSRVCGRVIAYQQGSTDAFHLNVAARGLEEAYVDGVSLTHGAAGSRQHIWTFASAIYEMDPDYITTSVCACSNTEENWNLQVPSFIRNNSYFCDSGSSGPGFDLTTFYSDDPLWDGEGCGSTSSCCEFNRPPWFCSTTFAESTTDDLELRICRNEARSNEDLVVSFVEMYVM